MQRIRERLVWLSILTFGLTGSLAAQNWLERGPLNTCSGPLNKVLPLRVNQSGRLELDRQVWEANSISPEEREQKELKKWIDRGLDEDRAREFVTRSIRSQSGFDDQVEEFANHANMTSRSGSSRQTVMSGANIQLSIRKELPAHHFEALETSGTGRRLVVSDNAAGRFYLLITGDDFLVEIDQKADQQIKVSMILGEKLFGFRGMRIQELAEKHPEENEVLWKIVANVGVDIPPVANSDRVRRAALDQLKMLDNDNSELQELFAAMESSEFSVRDQARESLIQNFDRYEALIRQKSTDSQASLELRTSLIRIIIDKQASAGGDFRAVDLVTREKLLDSPS